MAVSARVVGTERDLVALVNQALSPPARQAALAEYAREALADGQQQNQRILGRIPPHDTTVDNRRGAPLESVNPDRGTIVFEFQVFDEVLRFIGATLVERSPFKSGAYRNAHALYADGQLVPLGGIIPPAESYLWLNPLPYSRKIEVGRMKMKVSGTSGVYQQAAQIASRRYGNMANIRFTYEAAPGNAGRVPAIRVTKR